MTRSYIVTVQGPWNDTNTSVVAGGQVSGVLQGFERTSRGQASLCKMICQSFKGSLPKDQPYSPDQWTGYWSTSIIPEKKVKEKKKRLAPLLERPFFQKLTCSFTDVSIHGKPIYYCVYLHLGENSHTAAIQRLTPVTGWRSIKRDKVQGRGGWMGRTQNAHPGNSGSCPKWNQNSILFIYFFLDLDDLFSVAFGLGSGTKTTWLCLRNSWFGANSTAGYGHLAPDSICH